jgi:peptidoglycan hydrolase CwlO-like protein
MKTILVVVMLMLLMSPVFVGCDSSHRQTYEELKSENEHLEFQLAEIREKVQQAKSDLDDLKTEIESRSYDEDSANSKADDIETTLDEAEEESN